MIYSYKPLLLSYANNNPDLKLALEVVKSSKDMENTLIAMINGIKKSEANAHVSNEENIHEIGSVQNNIRNGYDVLKICFSFDKIVIFI